MSAPMLLEPKIEDGKLIFTLTDTRELCVHGGKTPYTSFKQELMDFLELYDDGETADVKVDQEFVVDPDDVELRITETIPIEGVDVLDELPTLDEPEPEPAAPSAD